MKHARCGRQGSSSAAINFLMTSTSYAEILDVDSTMIDMSVGLIPERHETFFVTDPSNNFF